jgi:DNA-binding SARP family transcriptional activator
MTTEGRHGEAIEAGLAAIDAEPLRESAHRAVIAVHIAEGNLGEALRQYEVYRSIARCRLGIEPSGELQATVAAAVGRCFGTRRATDTRAGRTVLARAIAGV